VKLKLDENLGRSHLELLRRAGHDVVSVVEQGLTSSTDRELIAVCQSEGRCLVTLDQEFGNPLLFHPQEYPGIAVVRLSSRPTSAEFRSALETLVQALERSEIKGRLWIVQASRVREYRPDDEDIPL
jgi:predicted nuclease of predicted toxin-antitoxin system